MDLIEAIEKRISCRAFTEQQLPQEVFDELADEIAAINGESGFHFQLYGPRENGTAIDMSPMMFASNPPAYAAFIAPKDPFAEEKLGYYGERFVLKATQLGLGTCWVASTYDQKTTRVELEPGDALHDVVPIGYAPKTMPLRQRTIRAGIRKRNKKLDEMFEGPVPLSEAPAWIQACIDGVAKGPSAINEQPVVFSWAGSDSPVVAKLARVKTGLEYTDLGIAKQHFEVVAHACGIEGRWTWGDEGVFEQ